MVLGIRLSDEGERRLERLAVEVGRPKSVIARDWIMDRLEREELDGQIRHAANLHGRHEATVDRQAAVAASDAFSSWLDAMDGGYDWGAEGPPPPR